MRSKLVSLPAALLAVIVLSASASAQQNNTTPAPAQAAPSLVPMVTSETEFDNQTVRSKVPVMAVFCLSSSQRCGLQMPIVEEVAKEYAGRVKFIQVDAEAPAMQNILVGYNVTGVPTFLMFSQPCVKIKGTIGGQYKPDLERAVEDGLKACPTSVSGQ